MPDQLRKAHNVVDAIIDTLAADIADLEAAPEIHRDTTHDALHRLEAQIFILTDALAEMAQVVQDLLDQPAPPRRNRRGIK